jgi:hypothetical protein
MKKIFALLGLITISTAVQGQIEIYNEDFETSGIPATFTIVDNDGLTPNTDVSEYTEAWINKVDPLDPMNNTASSTSYFEPTGEASRWLITPSITLGPAGNVLFWDALSHDPSFPDGYRILVSRTDTQIASFTDTLYFIFGELADEWQTRQASLGSIGLDGETVHIAFINETENGFKLYIDNIRVEKENYLAVTQFDSAELVVYPNPAQNLVTIKNMPAGSHVKIIGMDGKTVLNSDYAKIDISALSAGKYIVELISDNQIVRTSIVKN